MPIKFTLKEIGDHRTEKGPNIPIIGEVKVKGGDELDVGFESQATGFRWALAKYDKTILQFDKEIPPSPDQPKQDRPGDPALRVFRFRILKPGGVIEFSHLRANGKADPFTPRVNVVLRAR